MDIGTILGVLAGAGLIGFAIISGSSGGIMMFVNAGGIAIVVGGTLAATAIAFPTRELKLLLPVTARVFRNPKSELLALVQFLIECKKLVATQGPLALEEKAVESGSKPLEKGLLLISDGADPDTIQEILATEQRLMEENHRVGQKIFSEMGKYAPAFGMVGTLIGLVQMLASLNDPANIGPAMAVALLTTLYGALLSNMLFIPMVNKLDRRIRIEARQIQLMLVGLDAIGGGDSIAIMRERLKTFLAEQPGDLDELLK